MSRRSPAELIAALEENLLGLWCHFGRGEGCALHQEQGTVWFETPIPSLPYNGVLKSVLTDAQPEILDRIVDHFDARGVEHFWLLHPTSMPENLEELLGRRGFTDVETITGMGMDLSGFAEAPDARPGYRISEVTDESELGVVLDFVSWRWNVAPEHAPHYRGIVKPFRVGAPGSSVRCWAAWQRDRVVSKAIMYSDHGVAGIYGVSTVPEARGQGLARALLAEALSAAKATGADLAVLHSSPLAVPLYETIGFRPAADFKVASRPGQLHV